MSRSEIFVTPEWLAARLNAPDVIIIDGSYYLSTMNRNAGAEYLAGHIPGAVRFDIDTVKDQSNPLPHMMPKAAAFAEAASAMGIGDGMTIIVYDGLGLFSAPRVRWMFKAFGARDVRLLDGGFPAWTAQRHPVAEGPQAPRPRRSFTARFDATAVADLGDIRRTLHSGDAQVIDARPADRFRGEAPEPRAGVRSGHMPGSYNLPFGELLANGQLKDEAAIKAAFTAAGIDLNRPLITSCGSGVSAAILSVALELIGHPARSLYDGSWAEWGTVEGCPVGVGSGRN
jgi:thiosulfate/3-mercaptopyruvate sulfurtransferase